ncbi:MAG: SMC-Scp complex subunit ScpB [candidate division Zixibacteria bacterium]|nr:SMC-Scp complex subunit ScpB [candidate division Zixibacteria bacterium]
MDLQNLATDTIQLSNIDKTVEALIAVSEKPVPVDILVQVVKDLKYENEKVTKTGLEADLENIVLKLNTAYKRSDNSFRIERVAGGYRLMTLSDYDHHIRKYLHPVRQQRLSRAALETLAVIAYRQPVPRTEIERLRGVSADGVVRTLLDRGLVKISGRADSPGRPLLYSTDEKFLEYFGLNDLSELPDEKEIESLLGESEEAYKAKLTIKREGESGEEDSESNEDSAPKANSAIEIEPEENETELNRIEEEASEPKQD